MARQQPSLTDWVVIACSPALIMLMLGSLVFFLLEVLHRGQYHERVLYILFWYVFAIVLVARISIEQGSTKAALYGIGLGLATLIPLNLFVQYPKNTQVFAMLINIFLMVLVWWCANKLTWDCTHIDEDRKASGRGVLTAAGLDDTTAATESPPKPIVEIDPEEELKEKKKRKKDPEGVLGWWARYERYKAAQKLKPHTPGVWIVYFALAALPIFGLGQALIPAGDEARRATTFKLMAVYVGSALGLLVTTSLLGLRKYLRDRGATAPAKMTIGWLGLGAGLIVLFLAVGAFMPRPHSETPLFRLNSGEKKDRSASKYAVVKDEAAGKGDGKAGKKTESSKDGKASGKSEHKGGNAGEKGSGGGKGDDKGDGKGDSKGDQKQGGDKGNKSGNKSGEKSGEKNANKNNNKNPDGKDSKDAKNDEQKNDSKDDQKGEGSEEQSKDADKGDSDGSSNSSSPSQVSKVLENVASFVKWIVWIAVAIIVIGAVILFFVKYLAPFTEWARSLLAWWNSLFAKKPRGESGDEEEAAIAEKGPVRPPPFSSFSNPFDDGSAKRMTIEALIEYSFEAFDSWAWDRDRGRKPDETPNEFAGRLGREVKDLDKPGRSLASLYVWVLYSEQDLPGNAKALVKDFWIAIEQAEIEEPEYEVETT